VTKALGKLLGTLSNEVAKEVDFEAQPEPFDWIEIGAVAWQVMNLEVVPIQSLGFVPTGVVNDEQSTFGVHRGNLLCQKIKVILEDIGIDSIKNHRAAFATCRTHRPNDVGSYMVSEIRHFRPVAPSAPAPPRARIALHPAFVGKP
jgi:hypothetical protein